MQKTPERESTQDSLTQPPPELMVKGDQPAFNHALILGGYHFHHLAPLFDPQFKPDRLVIISNQSNYGEAINLKKEMSGQDIDIDMWLIATDRGVDYVFQALSHYLSREKNSLALNLSGGHPLLSYVAHHSFSTYGLPTFYCKGDLLYHLSPQPQWVRLAPKYRIKSLLSIYGMVANEGRGEHWFEENLEDVCHFLIESAHEFAQPLTVLHRLADQAEEKLKSPSIKGADLMTPYFQMLVEHFERAGCCELQRGHLLFSSESHRTFCAGGWIALYAYHQINLLQSKIHLYDIRQAIDLELTDSSQFPSLQGKVRVDLACIVNESLYLFFCPQLDESVLQRQLDLFKKLKTQLPAQAIILSHLPLPDHLKQRADDLGVKLCAHLQLKEILEWLSVLFLERDTREIN